MLEMLFALPVSKELSTVSKWTGQLSIPPTVLEAKFRSLKFNKHCYRVQSPVRKNLSPFLRAFVNSRRFVTP